MSIEELGPVNLNAIEQFEEINTRYTFLDEQRADLRAAKLTLEQLIDEMHQEVKDRFKETFHAVQGHFADVFKSLLVVDKQNYALLMMIIYQRVWILLCNHLVKTTALIVIKWWERALSAIALLFAILKVRSAPFVILDEVEAALDEANVIRYAQYLKELSIRLNL